MTAEEARKKALSLLERRDYGSEELKAKLIEKGASPSDAEAAVARFAVPGYLSEADIRALYAPPEPYGAVLPYWQKEVDALRRSLDEDRDLRRARSYLREAEYYEKRAASYLREAEYYEKRAASARREAAYWLRRGDDDRAKTYVGRAEEAMERRQRELRRARDAEERAGYYRRRAARVLER